jgi:hypothetical protein
MATKTLSIKTCLLTGWNLLVQRPGLWMALTALALVAASISSVLLLMSLIFFVARIDQGNAAAMLRQKLADSWSLDLPMDELVAYAQELNPAWIAACFALGWAVSLALKISWSSISIKAVQHEPYSIRDFFSPLGKLRNFITFALASILFSLVILVGSGLPALLTVWLMFWLGEVSVLGATFVFAVTSAILIPMFSLWPYLAMQRQLGPWAALASARCVSRGARVNLLLLIMILGLVEWALGLIPLLGYLLAVLICTAWSNLALAEASRALAAQTESHPPTPTHPGH